ncbi:MAG: DM13 domain-containing protein [Anaerolineae bacterium]|nr:DM13 domain-containing protein [Anaerolineae bacterium]
MRTRPHWLLLSLGALIVLMLFLFPMWWPLVAGRQPVILFPGVSAEEQVMLETLQAIDPTQAALTYISGTPTAVPEELQAMPELERPVILSRGVFVTIDALHWARGVVTLFKDAGGAHLLRFENFEARNGPALEVLLSIHPEPRTPAEVHQGAGAITLGQLVGSLGDQNYPVQSNVDLTLYNSVVLYSREMNVVFSTASLRPVIQ